jgi:hypothetical protein
MFEVGGHCQRYSITSSARASRVPAGETRVFVPDVQ